VVRKAEIPTPGENPRFVVTSVTEVAPALLYPADCERGQGENFLKDCKTALQADRLSGHTVAANFFRLREHAAACVLLHAWRTQVASRAPRLGRTQFDTRRLSLLKVAAIVAHSARRLLVRLPHAFPLTALFRQRAQTLAAPPLLSSAYLRVTHQQVSPFAAARASARRRVSTPGRAHLLRASSGRVTTISALMSSSLFAQKFPRLLS
jgi:Transposase DDE domain group 1